VLRGVQAFEELRFDEAWQALEQARARADGVMAS
jgi:hypothetical protein